MNGEVENGGEDGVVEDDLELIDEATDTAVLDDISDIDNVGDISVEINVEELVAKIESSDEEEARHRKEVHRRLEELAEQRRIEQELESTFDFSLDDDL